MLRSVSEENSIGSSSHVVTFPKADKHESSPLLINSSSSGRKPQNMSLNEEQTESNSSSQMQSITASANFGPATANIFVPLTTTTNTA